MSSKETLGGEPHLNHWYVLALAVKPG